MKNKVFWKNTFYLYSMNIVKIIFPLLTLPYLTRILSTNMYGVVVYTKSIVVYVQLIIDFGFLLSATKKIVYARNRLEINKIIGDTMIEKMILGTMALILFIVSSIFIPILNENFAFSFLYVISSLMTIFIFDFLFRGIEKMWLISIPYVASKTITTIFTFFLIKNDSSIMFLPMLEIVGNGLSIIISIFFVYSNGYKFMYSNYKTWIKDIVESSIYFASNFATTIFGAFTTVISGFFLSTKDIAYWGLCMQIVSAAKSLYNPLSNSLYPKMLKDKNLALLNKISMIMSVPMILGTLLVLFKSDFILTIIGGEKYAKSGYVLVLLLPTFIFSFYSMMYGWPVLGAINKVKETSSSTILASTFQFILLVILAIFDQLNLHSLAIGCSLTEFILFVIRFSLFKKYRNQFS